MRFMKPIGLVMLFALTLASVQAAPPAQRQYVESVSGSSQNVKHPSLAQAGGQIAIAYSTGEAVLAIKNGGGQGFASKTVLGKTGNPTYFNHAVAAGPNGAGDFRSAWSENGSRVVYNAPGIGARTIASNLGFAHFIDIAVASNGRTYVVWRNLVGDEPAIQLSYSDNGSDWTAPILVTNQAQPLARPRLAAGPNNSMYLTFGSAKGDIYVGTWNGNNFVLAKATDGGGFDADPSIAVTPNGGVFAAWRVVGAGAYWGQQNSPGNWTFQQIFGGDAAGSVGIDADAGGNLHMGWSSKQSGDWEVYYSARLANGEWTTPENGSVNGAAFDVNVDVVGVAGGQLAGHVAYEAFVPSGPDIRHTRFVSQGGAQPQPTPQPTPSPTPQPTPSPTPAPDPNARFFPETGQSVGGRLLEYWNQSGGLPVFGLPLEAEADRQTLDGRYRMQLFERNRLELHPENARPYDVLLGRLGGDLLYKQGRPWETLPREQPRAGCKYFAETQHNLCEPFLSYWRTHGLEFGDPGVSERESLALFGLPLTSVNVESNPDGWTGQTQWFERARFEFHPENNNPYKVLLGRLGAETR
jgi:hypothetical protein